MNEKGKLVLILFLATILKIIIILFSYQHVIEYDNSVPKIASGYGWDQLVSSLFSGSYEMKAQTGLTDLYDLSSKSYRPPIYPLFLYFSARLTSFSPFALILLQSIITSLVAYLAYKIVSISTENRRAALSCLVILFIFPMNFLKSGSIDENPLAMVFLLASIYYLNLYINQKQKFTFLVFAGFFLGLSSLTRYTNLILASFVVLFLFFIHKEWRYKYKSIAVFFISFIFILFPWIFRNYKIYGRFLLSTGSGRILLLTQSDDFIKYFPNESIDNIERKFMSKFYLSHAYLGTLDELSLDKEFTKLALTEVRRDPKRFLVSFLVKLKPFIPYRYYPLEKNIVKDLIYTVPYFFSLLFFMVSIIKGNIRIDGLVILFGLCSFLISSLIFFVLSRHFYSFIILMILYSFIALSREDNMSACGYKNE